MPVSRVEWLLRDDGSIWRGDACWRGELRARKKPLLVVEELPVSPREPRPFGHVEP